MLKRILIALAAIIITVGVILGSAVIYQKTTMQPDLPTDEDCGIQQLVNNGDGSLEAHTYWCERGSDKQWQGHEVWLYEPRVEKWQRILTTEHDGCMKLTLSDQQLDINHDGDRGNMNLVEPVFLYNDANGVSQSLPVQVSTAGDADCSGE
ncbi:hypothetical protein [Idiomarina piscisalsi]|uniref:Uncharacterized protein n=1 Tax=Idiomarina piscisalsi TaxID=1096243 RepID=A0A432YWW9_9GAMM|nr:hypothetical protein [Idiomarina piscisalsi]RUO67823.1 hypothetical protein CWI73_02900 [Idiomarina piscisalsi]